MQYNYKNVHLRDAAILTNSYVAATVIDNAHEYNQLEILVDYTKGSLTSLELKIEISYNGTDWFQETNVAVSGGTSTLSANEYTYAGGSAKFTVAAPNSARYIQISAKGTGTLTSSSLTLNALLHAT